MREEKLSVSAENGDVRFFLRPGDLPGNRACLLKRAKAAARKGEKRLVFPKDALAGGDCGSLAAVPAFQAALAASRRAFDGAVKKIKNAPQIVFADMPPRWIDTPGPDVRLPFCGHAREVFDRQVQGLAQRLRALSCSRAVLGLSGGLDSALALLVAVAAFDRLGLSREGLYVCTMPGFGTTRRTRGNAAVLAKGLGLALETINIAPACRRHLADIGHPPGQYDVTFENTQARERTQILMDKANQLGGIVLGTGDMSEIALGWSTYNGDHMSMYGVNAGVPKTAVRDVCFWWAKEAERSGDGVLRRAARALFDILDTPVSPELLPVDGNVITQKTEEAIGPYPLHDYFLWHFVGEGQDPRALLAEARRVFRGVFKTKQVEETWKRFMARLHAQSFKRNCAPDGTRVFRAYFSPQAWHVPSDVSAAWLSL